MIEYRIDDFTIDLEKYQGDYPARIDLSKNPNGKFEISFARPPEISIEIPAKDVHIVKTGETDDVGIKQITRIIKPFDINAVKVTHYRENKTKVTAEFPIEKIDAERTAIENLSDGKNTIIIDDIGRPSVMVRIPKFKWSEVYDGGGDEICSAFIADGKELDCIYISKFLNVIEYGRAYSLQGRDPANSITIDEAREACARKGKGWHLLTNAEWCAIAHLCEKRKFRPGGNTNKGSDCYNTSIFGVPAVDGHRIDENIVERTLTGTGPENWSHDGTLSGIYDLVGNVWEHVAGLRLVDGEIQVIKDNDSALCTDESSESGFWYAIAKDGALISPGSPITYKYDSICDGNASAKIESLPEGFVLSTNVTRYQYTGTDSCTDGAYAVMPLRALNTSDGSSPAPILIKLGLAPVSENIPEHLFFVRNYGERMPQRGGSWYDGKFAGLWELYMRDSRNYVYPDMGFRAAYADMNI